jgi:hypothetical protein
MGQMGWGAWNPMMMMQPGMHMNMNMHAMAGRQSSPYGMPMSAHYRAGSEGDGGFGTSGGVYRGSETTEPASSPSRPALDTTPPPDAPVSPYFKPTTSPTSRNSVCVLIIIYRRLQRA